LFSGGTIFAILSKIFLPAIFFSQKAWSTLKISMFWEGPLLLWFKK
jgi:hypothetical protein